MLIVLPISFSDAKKIPSALERAFGVFSPGAGHTLLVIGSPNVSSSVNEAAQNLSKHFAGNASTYIFDLDCDLGWPTGCNYYFQQAAWYVGSNYNEPWLWYEVDTTPTRAGWLDEIDKAVHALQAEAIREERKVPRYFGCSEPTCLEYQGALMSDAGRQMAAVGVYPSNMDDVLSLRAVSATNIVWNSFLRWYVMADFAELPLIQNNWRTEKYARVPPDNEIGCMSCANWAWDVHFNKPIGPEVALVHGCKDGSLLDTLIQAQTPETPESKYWTDYTEPTREQKAEKVLAAQRELVGATTKEARPIPASYRRK